jgi:dTDP-4-amino-4,6-dideoxygalactose transaminase
MEKLAILGGHPVRDEAFPRWPVWDDLEEKALLTVLRSGTWGISTESHFIDRFEKEFAAAHHAKYGRSVFNGTAALEVSLRALEIDYGDEVIIPPYTFMATAIACLMVGAVPVFVDIDPRTYNLDPEKIEAAITSRTRVIIPVHIGGNPADMDRIMEIARKNNLWVIEDACQAHAAAWKGQRVGAIGDLGCFSFQSSKNINAGEGGIILSNNEQLAELCWSIHNCGRVREGKWYQHEVLGANYRMTEWQAAILGAQMTRFETLAQLREDNGLYLEKNLSSISGFQALERDARVTQHGYHLFISRYDASAFHGLPRQLFLEALKAEGIPCSEGYLPLYKMKAIQDGTRRLKRSLSVSEPSQIEPDCPACEKACYSEAVWFTQTMFLGTHKDMDDITQAVIKVKEAAPSLL